MCNDLIQQILQSPFAILFFLFVCSQWIESSSSWYVKQGLRQLKKGNCQRARHYFESALKRDSKCQLARTALRHLPKTSSSSVDGIRTVDHLPSAGTADAHNRLTHNNACFPRHWPSAIPVQIHPRRNG